jgi:hypothetical protein
VEKLEESDEGALCCKPGIVPWPACASVSYGQETNQFTEDDVEFSDLGRRSIYVAAVHVLGAFCVENFLGEIARRDQEPTKRSGCAQRIAGCPEFVEWAAAPT